MNSSIVFTGDIGFDKYMDRKWEDNNLLSDKITKYLSSGDHLVINVEGPLYEVSSYDGDDGALKLKHGMSPQAAQFFNKIGADVWNICNNHIMDEGKEGISSTLKIAKDNAVKTLGAGMNLNEAMKPVVFDEAGGIGLIGVGYQRACRKASTDTPGCFSWSDMDLIKKTIEEVKSKCRWCVIVAHGGEEFTALPSPYVRDRYIEYLNLGADIVVSHHPHVPLNYELFDNKAIFYSLGNFIFDTDYQRSQFNTEYGVVLKLNFNETEYSFDALGLKIDRNTEHVVDFKPPSIFTNVSAEEYELLKPLAAKVLIENTKRQLRYMRPNDFLNATDDDFIKNFYEPLRSGRVPGEVLDFQIVYPLSLEAESGEWKESKLEEVKEYMLKQLN